jgi:hypothetical protein
MSGKLSLSVAERYQHEIAEAVRKAMCSCINCEHWAHTDELCKKYNARPPAVVIVNACPEHSWDVPF